MNYQKKKHYLYVNYDHHLLINIDKDETYFVNFNKIRNLNQINLFGSTCSNLVSRIVAFSEFSYCSLYCIYIM